ncbi:hypothetical protein R5R35_010562 [Gryllus longicercus]|uniref:ABC transporter domain-containing protein n=1 Tax=Gryllus longicercus TaxID=2509291 RepID=A0AAN9V798_9ORTH
MESVDVEFVDLTFSVPDGRGVKKILRSVSGRFLSGELTAILGPSGAGKSTLLNILAGYRAGDVGGALLSNGRPRDPRHFRRQARYIMQEDLLQPHLSVREALRLAAELKLPPRPRARKRQAVAHAMEALGLTAAAATGAGELSGGERKRLSIALELLDDPPVIFLDEPTTGLDEQSGAQCVEALRALARGGRTVVCSIHTPSARLFAMFDHVYVVAAGACVYRGSVPHLVPYLSHVGLPCPTHYNPADYVIEVTSLEPADNIERMSATLEGGEGYRWRPPSLGDALALPLVDALDAPDALDVLAPAPALSPAHTTPSRGAFAGYRQGQQAFSAPWTTQFRTLLYRHLLQSWRDKGHLFLKIAMYFFMSLMVGLMYLDFGHDGSKTIFNFGFCYCCTIACQFVPMLPVLLQYPQEVKLLKREYFNRWYSFNAYFLAATVARLPAMLLFNSLYVGIVYVMTAQPLEPMRAAIFLGTCLLIASAAESWGLAIASALSMVNGMFIGSASTVPFMLLAVQGLGTGLAGLPILTRVAMHFSYMRYGLEGLVLAVYGFGRGKLQCPLDEEYCPYRHPKQILRETGLEDASLLQAFGGLVGSYVAFRAVSYVLLRWRLSTSTRYPTIAYVGRLIKRHFR